MFLSKLAPNLRSPMARRDLTSPYEMHRTLLNGGFDGIAKQDLGRVLFRVDTDRFGGLPVILVQSDTRPNWDKLPDKYLIAVAESKPFELVVTAGQRLRFRLRANPTKRLPLPLDAWHGKPNKDRLKGDRVALATEWEKVRWLQRKGAEGGFRVPGGWVSRANPAIRASDWAPDFVAGDWEPNFRVDVIPEGRDRNGKAGHREGAFVAVRFEGVLEITDPDLFVKTVHNGVGSAKGFGFGLLSVAPA